MEKFKPQLAPNEEINLEEIQYPLLASYKLDGIRCIFYKGQILSRSLKPIQNKQLKEKFEPLRKYSEYNNVILDGEIYSPELTFQQITSFVMTQDFEDKKSIKKFGKIITIPASLKFHCFDGIVNDDLTQPFTERMLYNCIPLMYVYDDLIEIVNHATVNSKEEIQEQFELALSEGFEGLILRDPNGRYKCGRGTIKEGLIYKVKPYRTFDAQITGVVQATAVNEDVEKKINELGRSVTSKKKDDRHLIEKASAFNVMYCTECNGTQKAMNGDEECTCPFCKELKVVLAMTDEEKEEVWKNKESYIGRYIQYKGMLVGAKDVPRHPTFERFRNDKDINYEK